MLGGILSVRFFVDAVLVWGLDFFFFFFSFWEESVRRDFETSKVSVRRFVWTFTFIFVKPHACNHLLQYIYNNNDLTDKECIDFDFERELTFENTGKNTP